MLLLNLPITIVLSLCATVVMSYISMATAIGPWIETTLVLFGMLFFYMVKYWYSAEERTKALGVAVAAGGIGGILAVGSGFAFPTYYFLDPKSFNELLNRPYEFAAIISFSAFAAGAFGLLMAHYFEKSMFRDSGLTFPIGELVYKMIVAADNVGRALMLALGFIGTWLYLGVLSFTAYASKPLTVLSSRNWGAFSLPSVGMSADQIPMFWAIGFVTGHVIAIPLLVGILSKLFVIDPLHYWYPQIYSFIYTYGLGSITQFPYSNKEISAMDFTLAFSSGLVVYGAMKGFFELPKVLKTAYHKIFSEKKGSRSDTQGIPWLLSGAVIILNILVLSYMQFSFLSQLYLLLFTAVCVYQLMIIAGKFGLAPMGRFATFVMVPGLIMFGYTPLQITLVTLYVEVAGGVACDALFGRKMAHLASIGRNSVVAYQWFGLLISTLAIGIIFWLFITHFGLGSEVGNLAATRAASRAFLISVKSFDVGALVFGLLFGHLLSYTNISPALLLGGILMPISYSLMLVFGGLSTYLVKDKEEYYPLLSGVYASNSLWMLARAFI
jgi:hypothetical protein